MNSEELVIDKYLRKFSKTNKIWNNFPNLREALCKLIYEKNNLEEIECSIPLDENKGTFIPINFIETPLKFIKSQNNEIDLNTNNNYFLHLETNYVFIQSDEKTYTFIGYWDELNTTIILSREPIKSGPCQDKVNLETYDI